MNDITNPSNPYMVVGSPNYATPVLNMFGDKSPTQGQQANQQNKSGQPTNTNQQQQPNFYQLLMRLFGGGAGQPMQLGSNASQGNIGGTAGNLPPIY